MTKTLKDYLDKVNVSVDVPLQLPKLKKSTPKEMPKINLPKLQKVEA